MMLHERREKTDLCYFLKHTSVVLCRPILFVHDIIFPDSPTVMRRCRSDLSSSWWSVVWVKEWKVALLVGVSSRLQERVMSLCHIIQVSVNFKLLIEPPG